MGGLFAGHPFLSGDGFPAEMGMVDQTQFD